MYSFLTRASSLMTIDASSTKIIKLKGGYLTYGWKEDLAEEEDNPKYLPSGYSNRVLELKTIDAYIPGNGVGTVLMKKFLSSPDAKAAELIFLDPNPGYGSNYGLSDESGQVDSLVRFYSRFGFRHNSKSATKRMWLVKVGSVSTSKLPK